MAQVANGKLTIQVEVKEFEGKVFLDIRNFYADDSGELRPTQKGIMFKPELGEDVAKAILEELDNYTKVGKTPKTAKSVGKVAIPAAKFPIYFVVVDASSTEWVIPKEHCYRSHEAAKNAERDFSNTAKAFIMKATHWKLDGKKVTIVNPVKFARWSGTKWVRVVAES